MSSNSKKLAQERLKTAVDWKIFEWQALLIGADGESLSDKELSKCKDWLQPIHYKEVVKERAHEGRCGYPCCNERIAPPTVDMDDTEDWLVNPSNPKFMKIDREHSKVLELGVEDRAKFFYCTRAGKRCLEHSKTFIDGMDSTIPVSRPCAYELDLSQASSVGGSAADVLKALSLATDSTALLKSQTKLEGARGGEATDGSSGSKQKRVSDSQSRISSGNESNSSDVGASQALKAHGGNGRGAPLTHPPLFTNKDLTSRGTLKPAKWSVKSSKEGVKLGSVGNRAVLAPALDAAASAVLAADPALSPDIESAPVARARDLLQSLQNDPTLRETAAGVSRKALGPALGGEGGGTPPPKPSRAATAGSDEKDDVGLKEEDEGVVYAPSVSPSHGARSQDAGGATAAATQDARELAKTKAAEAAERQKAIILAMKEKYRQGSKAMNLQGGPPVQQSQYPVPAPQGSPSPAASPTPAEKGGEVSGEDSSWGLKEVSPSPVKQATGEEVPKDLLNAEGFVDFSWRESRLDTSLMTAKTREEEAILAALPASSPTKGGSVPRARMKAKGVRARELAAKKEAAAVVGDMNEEEDKDVVVGVQGAPASEEEEQFVTHYQEDKHGGPVPANDNGVMAGEVREVEWKEPNEALLATLTPVQERIPLAKKEGGIDPTKRKESLFRQQQRHYMKLAAATGRQAGEEAKAGGQAIHRGLQPGPQLANMPGRKASAGAKSVQWEIKEVEDPSCLPEESLADKYNADDVAQPKDYESALPPRSSAQDQKGSLSPASAKGEKGAGGGSPSVDVDDMPALVSEIEGEEKSRVFDDDEDVIEPSTRTNHELRNEFFSREGVSLTLAARGTDVKQLAKRQRQKHVVGSTYDKVKEREERRQRKEARMARKSQAAQGGRADPSIESEEESDYSEEEGEESDESEEESAWEDSEEETDTGPPPPSFFLMAWTTLDDMLSHVGPVLKKKSLEGKATADAAATAAAAVMEADDTKQALTDTEAKPDAKVAVHREVLPPRQRTSVMATTPGSRPVETALTMLTRGITAAEADCGITEVLKGPVLSEYYQCKRRLLAVADAQAPCPPMTATGWKVLGLLTVDGIVRWRNLLFKQQNSRHSSTADEALAAWGSTVKRLVEGASSSRSGEVACDDDELRVLKSFFDDL